MSSLHRTCPTLVGLGFLYVWPRAVGNFYLLGLLPVCYFTGRSRERCGGGHFIEGRGGFRFNEFGNISIVWVVVDFLSETSKYTV